MYFRNFVVQFDEDEKAKEYGCESKGGYKVLAISAVQIPSARMHRGLPVGPQQTYILIRNDQNKLKWVSDSLVSVPEIE